MKKHLATLVKVLVAAALVWFVLSQIETQDRLDQPGATADAPPVVVYGSLEGDWRGPDWVFQPTDGGDPVTGPLPEGWRLQPGFFTALRGLTWGWFALGTLLWGVLLVMAAVRWQWLLRAADVPVSAGQALRLCFIGYFFNNVMFGATGGDLVRAVMVTRGLEQNRVRAALSVIVDRLIGLFALLTLAAIVLFILWQQDRLGEVRGLRDLAVAIYLVLGLVMVGAAAYLSQRARQRLGLNWLLQRLPAQPLIHKLDDAITVYRSRRRVILGALLWSLPLQVAGILSFWAIGHALGAGLSIADDFVIFPVVQTASAVPLAPAGWGVGETLYGWFFQRFGSSFTLGVAVSVLFRLTTQVGYGLIGGLVWVASRERRQGLPLKDPVPDES
ncbi:MAG: lysylphosphatidylglycerol synthase transmembrane domain-containing protein [Planctomycetota bacterium]|jgi:uncharacterized protein (TIRG00374 family)